MLKVKLAFFLCCFAFSSWSCNGGGNSKNTSDKKTSPTVQSKSSRSRQAEIVSPKNNERFPLTSDIILSLKPKNENTTVDSIRWFIDGKWIVTIPTFKDHTWNTSGQTTGTHRIEAVAYYPGGQREIIPTSILLLASKAPKPYTYKIIKTYPHDIKAYTQGLLFDDGFLYESTGLKGLSSLRKVDLTTGEVLQVMNIPPDMFGEGLALVDDRLVQITYKDQVAFVYNKSDFKLLNKITYPMREGWGIVYDGVNLLMTDGSANLYFLDKNYLTEIRRIEICDHNGPVVHLNELEYINGELWANVYLKDEILRINPTTGEVTGRIDMRGLLKASDQHAAIDVLNGIAYDRDSGKIYVTGKNWPKLFEIQVIEK
ncbi:MAG: glutaminyl-peptide cyclotransferase [Bacteroidales bacterium]|jgi:glutamine cyclotransferase|nr:glutaminyl-peptide cyclotransferase [Bacteroidales bacterium]